jgi:hypothetical protein
VFFCKVISTIDQFFGLQGVSSRHGKPSDFKDDEFVVYALNQQKQQYLIEYRSISQDPPINLAVTKLSVPSITVTSSQQLSAAQVISFPPSFSPAAVVKSSDKLTKPVRKHKTPSKIVPMSLFNPVMPLTSMPTLSSMPIANTTTTTTTSSVGSLPLQQLQQLFALQASTKPESVPTIQPLKERVPVQYTPGADEAFVIGTVQQGVYSLAFFFVPICSFFSSLHLNQCLICKDLLNRKKAKYWCCCRCCIKLAALPQRKRRS